MILYAILCVGWLASVTFSQVEAMNTRKAAPVAGGPLFYLVDQALLICYAVTPALASVAIINLSRIVRLRVALVSVKQFTIAFDRSHFSKLGF